MATHPDDQIRVSILAVRPSSLIPSTGRLHNRQLTATEEKELLLARKSYEQICAKALQDGVCPMTDGTDRVLQLPEHAVVMDCCKCKRAICRERKRLPAWAQTQLEEYGGRKDDGTGHLRPYCRECYD